MNTTARPGVYVADADDTLVDLALGTGLSIIAISGGATARLVRAIEAAGREARIVDAAPERTVDSVDAARAALASAHDEVFLDLRALLTQTLSDAAELNGDAVPLAAQHAVLPTTPDDREPLILLSGMLGDATLWSAIAAQLADVALPWPVRIDLDYSVAEMAASVLAAAPPTFAIAGHSLGGIVALEVQRQAPERVRRMALLATSARAPSSAQLETWQTWDRRTEAGDFDSIAADLAAVTLGPRARTSAPRRAENLAMAAAVGPAGFRRQLAAQSTRPDSLPLLGSVRTPVLVVSGELDDICPPALQQELCSAVIGAELIEIAGAGHMLPVEAPDEVAAALRTWLAAGQ